MPLGAIALAIALRHVPESRDDAAPKAVDWWGGVLATSGLGALAYGLTAASDLSWSHPVVLASLAASVPLLAAFVWCEKRAAAPMMPLPLFRSKQFSGANAVTLLLYFALGGAFFFVPFNLIGVQGYSALQAGAAFLPFTLIMGGLSRWSGALIGRYGARLPLTVGPVVVAFGLALCAMPAIGQSYWSGFFPAMCVLGLGMAVSVAPLTTTVMQSAGEQYGGVASGINNATSRVAGMLAVSLLGAIAVGEFRADLNARLTAAHVPPELHAAVQAEASKLAGAKTPAVSDEHQREQLTRILHEAFVHSFRVVMLLASATALLSALCGSLTITGAERSFTRPATRLKSPESRGRR